MGPETRTRRHAFLVNGTAATKTIVNMASRFRSTKETVWLEDSEFRELREEGGDQITPTLVMCNDERP